MTLPARFWSRVDASGGADACWPFMGARSAFGYGVLGRGRRGEGNVHAHRLSWELANGLVPEGLAVMHSCDNPPCVNPLHLRVGTWADNNRDMTAKGRHGYTGSPGEKHPAAKLTRAKATEIRASAERSVDLARRYGVSRCAIADVRKGRTWL